MMFDPWKNPVVISAEYTSFINTGGKLLRIMVIVTGMIWLLRLGEPRSSAYTLYWNKNSHLFITLFCFQLVLAFLLVCVGFTLKFTLQILPAVKSYGISIQIKQAAFWIRCKEKVPYNADSQKPFTRVPFWNTLTIVKYHFQLSPSSEARANMKYSRRFHDLKVEWKIPDLEVTGSHPVKCEILSWLSHCSILLEYRKGTHDAVIESNESTLWEFVSRWKLNDKTS